MKRNQVFTILQKSGGPTAARIITDKKKNISKIQAMIIAHRLRMGVPVAKIIKEKWFYGMPFYTNRWTLDPRPDSETLVDAVLSEKIGDAPVRILDLGTGTGCLVCALIKNMPRASGVAIDKSIRATMVAKKNVKDLGLRDKIKVLRRSFNSRLLTGKFDIIVSNPPYIAPGDARVNTGARYDPKVALYAKKEGLAAYKVIAKNASRWLAENGRIYLEIGAGQSNAVRAIFTSAGWHFIKEYYDLSGTARVLRFDR